MSRSSNSMSAENPVEPRLVSSREETADSWLSDGELYPVNDSVKEERPRRIKWDRPRAWMPANAYSILPNGAHGADQDDQIPSIWDYNPRCLPKELTGLDLGSFLMNSTKRNLCFLPQKALIKICEKLIPLDFVNLSSTCRYLHWRMYTSTTCYAPYTVQIKIRDRKLSGNYHVEPETYTYTLDDDRRDGLSRASRRYLRKQIGRRGVFLFQPGCLKKPFFFEKLELTLQLPKYEKDDIDRCLSAIVPIRQLAKDLTVTLLWDRLEESEDDWSDTDRVKYRRPFIDYSAINEFFKAIKATAFYTGVDSGGIYLNSPIAKKMDQIGVDLYYEDKRQTIFCNRVGYYVRPTNAAVLRTLNEWRFGTTPLEFHSYHNIQTDDVEDRYPLLDYLYSRCQLEDVEEYYVDYWGHMWMMWLLAEDGRRRLRVVINRPMRFQFIYMDGTPYYPACDFFMDQNPRCWSIYIGREEVFDQRFAEMYGEQTDKRKWKMETAVEAENMEPIEETELTELTEQTEGTDDHVEEEVRRQSQGEASPRRVTTYDSPTLSFLAKIVEKKVVPSQPSDGRPEWNPNF